MAALGRTNDAVLYGGQVHLTVEADDDALASSSSGCRPRRPRTTASRSARSSRTRTSTSTRSTRCCSARRRSGSRASGAAGASRRGGSTSRCWSARSGADGRDPGVERRLARTAADRTRSSARGHEHRLVPVTRMVGRIDGDVAVRSRQLWLDGCDAVIVRGIPRGSLEQVIFRVDALHALVARGVACVNGPRAIERTVDKFLASALLARAGVPTPRTIACERPDDALEAFDELGGDVIVKPLFGSMGAGMTRVDDARRGLPRLPRAGARARRLLPAGDAAARRPRHARVRRRRAGARGDRAGRHGVAGEPRARRPARGRPS